jgi:hypothetical protein
MTERIIAGGALLGGPVLWLVGLILRRVAVSAAGFSPEQGRQFASEPFAAHEQLAAYVSQPGLTTAGYAVFLVGVIVMIPATAALARLASTSSRVLAPLGGLLALCGLLARVYFTGVEQVSFSLADSHGVDFATTFVLDNYVEVSYGPWRVPVVAAFGQYVGAVVLAAGLYRARILGTGRSLILVLWATMWTGVLKAAGWTDVLGGAALFLVLAPLAVHLIHEGVPRLVSKRRLLSW